ncbi:TPA: IS4 family transposase [Klebsiella pneumoniae]|nr:IS4 family transposase [Klebsiella pneumoniae]HCQ7206332.1 IS4 family transposase [Klebsiella pneumoniae]
MNVPAMLADFLEIVTPKSFHKHLLNSLTASLQSLLTNGQCTVTAIGRGIESLAQERHCIKRADRLLSHTTMQQAVPEFYTAMTGALVKGKQPLILVDWSNADKERRHFILRASLAVEGRAMTLLQMVTTESDYNCPHLHKAFFMRLKAMLPKRCRPVITTDAGFKVPWFEEVSNLGWHFIGRVRGNVSLRLPGESEFISVAKAYKKARPQPMVLGEIALGQSQQYACRA